jgi:hypothetical protein
MRAVLLLIPLFLFAHSARAQLALDGTGNGFVGQGSFSSVVTTTPLTTANSGDVIIAQVNIVNTSAITQTVTSVTGGGLTFTKRHSTGSLSGTSPLQLQIDIWWAVAASPVSSANFTASFSASVPQAGIVVWGVSGANTATPFDVNASLPKVASSTSATATPTATGVSTTAANTMIFASTVANSTGNPGSGYTFLATDSVSDNEYKIVSSVQSNITVAFGAADAGTGYGIIVDAIQQGSAGVTPHFFGFVPATVP